MQAAAPGMNRIPAVTFRMGADHAYREEAPVHDVTAGGFRMDRHAVTNRDFAAFAAATAPPRATPKWSTTAWVTSDFAA